MTAKTICAGCDNFKVDGDGCYCLLDLLDYTPNTLPCLGIRDYHVWIPHSRARLPIKCDGFKHAYYPTRLSIHGKEVKLSCTIFLTHKDDPFNVVDVSKMTEMLKVLSIPPDGDEFIYIAGPLDEHIRKFVKMAEEFSEMVIRSPRSVKTAMRAREVNGAAGFLRARLEVKK